MSVHTIKFKSFKDSIPKIMDQMGAREILEGQKKILIKPNLVNATPHPVTTHVDMCRAVVDYVLSHSKADLIIAEGTGSATAETMEVFHTMGYTDLAREKGISLMDLNVARLHRVELPGGKVFKEMFLPEVAFYSFIISLPVLKAHSLAHYTGTLKNMMGFAPPKHYGGDMGSWKKAIFHQQMQASISDLNSCFLPDLTIMDASIGMAEYHLGGATCSPHVNRLVAGYDPYEVDRHCTTFLGLDWKDIGHLRDR